MSSTKGLSVGMYW